MTSLNAIHARDVLFALGDAGVPVVYGTHTTKGVLLNEALEVLQMNASHYAVQDTTLTLVVASGSLGTLKNNTSITVDGKTYQINKWIQLGNGMETKIWLLMGA